MKEFLDRLNKVAEQIETSPESVDLGTLAAAVKDLIKLVEISREIATVPFFLPKEFKSCPNCGSTRRFCEMAMTDEVPAPGQKKKTPVLMSGEYVYDGLAGPIILQGLFDVCCDCGILYCVMMQKVQSKIAPLSPPGGPPGRPRGGRRN